MDANSIEVQQRRKTYHCATATPPFIREVVRQWMANEMSDISEETIFSGWESGLEFRLWRAVQALPEPHEYCGTVIDAERIERLRDVSEWLGEWMVWRDPDGVTPVPLDVWKSELSVGGRR